jgi:hypothetical protein
LTMMFMAKSIFVLLRQRLIAANALEKSWYALVK